MKSTTAVQELNQTISAKLVTAGIYQKTFIPKNIFDSTLFASTNLNKVDEVLYMIFCRGNSPRFGAIFGRKGNQLFCPFSAPFGYIEMIRKEQSIEDFYETEEALEKIIRTLKIESCTFFLPPYFYDNFVISGWYNTLFQKGWNVKYIDLNFALYLPECANDYEKIIHHNARKNLRISLEAGLALREAVTDDDRHTAYDIIRQNRASKGYPLRMNEEQVMKTISVVPSHMYIVKSTDISTTSTNCRSTVQRASEEANETVIEKNIPNSSAIEKSFDKQVGEDIAAALVYDVTDDIAQVVYWGDIPGHAEKKVINFLAYQLIQIYHARGFRYLDIGPSTEEGEPNFGLCDFKDSIGCMRMAKVKFTKQFAAEGETVRKLGTEIPPHN